jgi:hypothetical protein
MGRMERGRILQMALIQCCWESNVHCTPSDYVDLKISTIASYSNRLVTISFGQVPSLPKDVKFPICVKLHSTPDSSSAMPSMYGRPFIADRN